jgi:chromosome segregation ATPase
MTDNDPFAALRAASARGDFDQPDPDHDIEADAPVAPPVRNADRKAARSDVIPGRDDTDAPSFDQLKGRFEAVMVAETERRREADATAERLSRHIDQMMATIESQRQQLADERSQIEVLEGKLTRSDSENRQLRRMVKGLLDYIDRGGRDRLTGLLSASEERLAASGSERAAFLGHGDE